MVAYKAGGARQVAGWGEPRQHGQVGAPEDGESGQAWWVDSPGRLQACSRRCVDTQGRAGQAGQGRRNRVGGQPGSRRHVAESDILAGQHGSAHEVQAGMHVSTRRQYLVRSMAAYTRGVSTRPSMLGPPLAPAWLAPAACVRARVASPTHPVRCARARIGAAVGCRDSSAVSNRGSRGLP